MHTPAPQINAPKSIGELLEKLNNISDSLPKRLGQCARFTQRHLHLIAVSTVSELAEACEVAPSVYMRFCRTLGFSGYSEMQALFRAHYSEFRPEYDVRLANLAASGSVRTNQILADFTEASHKSLLSISNTATGNELLEIARGLADARVIHLIGLRRAFAVTSHMAYLFEKLNIAYNLHNGVGLLNGAGTVMESDAVFAVSFSPFSSETSDFALHAAERKIPVFGLSDSTACPFAQAATGMLYAQEDEVAGFRSLAASMTLTTALTVAVGARRDKS